MKITYLGHSGFSVELEHTVLLFDYYIGKLPVWSKDKSVIVFASHSHSDHFNWRILRLVREYPNLHYFFGNDIRLGEKWLIQKELPVSVKEKVTKLAGGREAVFRNSGDEIRVKTLKSTDSGVAFIVEAEGKRIYHAGDLNWWHWIGEPEDENAEMGRAYKREIDQLTGLCFDAAFVPVDPRLEDTAFWGMKYFLDKTESVLTFPMHMWGKYEEAQQIIARENEIYVSRIAEISHGGQEWNI